MTQLPYAEIPPAPDSYTAGTVLGRLLDGLGFRYYWATESLTEEQLGYRPCASARSVRETLDHLLSIARMIRFTVTGERFALPEPGNELSFEETRAETLTSIAETSERFKQTPDEQFAELQLRFAWQDEEHDFPFWNAINGTVADALNHVGQVVSHRRAAGNPQHPDVQVFFGIKAPLP